MYFISAPFGNYIKTKKAVSVTGTWTLNPRPGRFLQLLKTLRYTRQGWVNKLGLRNEGVISGLLKTKESEVLSIAAITKTDWVHFLNLISPKQSIELNVSCPNLEAHHDTTTWEAFYNFPYYIHSRWCIVKIPPIASFELVDKLIDRGFTQIHASNTLPTNKGGLSGKSLIPYTLKLLEHTKNKYPHVEFIAGGGVSSRSDVQRYLNAGADHISLGSINFTPWKLMEILK